MLMKKYPIRSSATTIEAIDGSSGLPQETLEYLEIQPPAEAMLPWTDLDNEVSSWRRNQAISPPSLTFLNEFLSVKRYSIVVGVVERWREILTQLPVFISKVNLTPNTTGKRLGPSYGPRYISRMILCEIVF